MRLGLLFFGGWAVLCAQNCVPAGILPGSQVSGALDSSACALSGGAVYNSYSIALPVRGQLQIKLTPNDGTVGLILRDISGTQVAAGASVQQPVEAGGYTILVTGKAGPYQIQPLFTPEPGMWCTAFPNLGLNQTVAGSLGSSGCAAPDGTPYEAYWVNTFGAGTLTATVSAANLNALLSVRDSSGALVASGTNTVTANVLAGSQYELVLSQVDNAGAFQLATGFQAAAAETCVPQKTFTGPATDTAAITGSSCSMVIDGSGDLQFYNYYLLTVPNAGLAHIAATTADFHPTLYLLDAAGNQLALDSEGAGAGKSDIQMQLPAGSYIVELLGDASSGGGNYTFSYAFTAGNPQPCRTTALASPATEVSGALSAASCRTSLGLADVYTVTLAASGVLSVNLAASGFTGQVAIRDANDSLIVSNEDVEGLGVAGVSTLLAPGAYTIVAAAAGGSGAYQLTPAFAAQPVSSCANIATLAPNSGFVQNIGASGCSAADGQPADYYQFTLPSDSVVAAVMTSTSVAGLLTLTDANGNFLRSDTDSYSYNDPLIVQFLKTGAYQLSARAAEAGSAGLYQITVLAAAGARPSFCAPLAVLTPGSISGALSYNSCQYVDNTFADMYQIDLDNPGAIDVTLTTAGFDPYLVLLDAKGNVVAQAADDGGGVSAHIAQTLAAGKYFILAKPFSGYNSVGTYQLTFQQQ
jgi:hypothetical protein